MNVKENKVVDHINHDTLDNTKGNLRVISHSNNSMNRILIVEKFLLISRI